MNPRITFATLTSAAMLMTTPLLALEAGEEAPAIALPVLGGTSTVTLADYRGKIVYLDFWASWCPPCLVSMPLMSELRDSYTADGKPFEVVAVNVDADPQDGLDFLLDDPVNYVVASDPLGTTPRLYGIKGMPTSYLLDASGTVRLVHEGFQRSDIELIRGEVDKLLEEMDGDR